MRTVLIAAALAVTTAPALAEITIHRAAYKDGVLTVRGETSRPNQTVTIDSRFTTRTGRNKQFHLRVRYAPRDCSITVRAGREARPAVVTNCPHVGRFEPKRPRAAPPLPR